ncbi:serine hydrolase domain-containing protein [Herbaspirillum seropedicae]|uniref:serine hydrolase domain-containing protein n=1 Tax=Herbaspirillum seropedicae TaxID=964 RepID=UPI0031D46AC1
MQRYPYAAAPVAARRRSLLAAALAAVMLLPGCPTWAQETAPSPLQGLEARVDAQMGRLLAAYPIPGASIAIAYQGRLVYQRGYGMAVTETQTPVTPQTRFRIGSISKFVTAMAVLKLFEGELPEALERRVFGPDGLLPDAAYPDFAQPLDRRALKITLRDLLQHTAGWGDSDYEPLDDLRHIAEVMKVQSPASAKDVIAYVLKQRLLDAAPGTEFFYDNFAYVVLGRIIEQRSGLPYAQAVQALVWHPAGVSDAAIAADGRAGRAAGEAVYYDDARWPTVTVGEGEGAAAPQSYGLHHFSSMDATAGWIASAADLVQFVDAAQGRNRPGLLQPQTVALMKQRHPRMPDNPYGLGWVLTRTGGVDIISHSGALPAGSYAYLQSRADGWSWAVLFNRMPVAYPPEQDVEGLQAFQAAVQRGLMAAIVQPPAVPVEPAPDADSAPSPAPDPTPGPG